MAPLFARGEAGDDALVVIADAASIGARAYIAKQLAKAGFSKIEPISGTTLYAAAKKFEKENDFKQLKATMGFIGDCMTGTGQTPFLSAVEARRKGSRKGTAQFGPLVDLGLALIDNPTSANRLALLDGFYRRDDSYCFRREMFYAMRAALLICISRPSCALADAIWEVLVLRETILRGCNRAGKRRVRSVPNVPYWHVSAIPTLTISVGFQG